MQTLLYGARETEVAGAAADRDRLWIPLDALPGATGWTAKPEGLCRDEVCVPIAAAHQDWLDGDRLDFAAFAGHLGHTVARDEQHGAWSFGPSADHGSGAAPGQAAGPVIAPDVRLPDLDGNLHALSDYRGKKILLYAWASW